MLWHHSLKHRNFLPAVYAAVFFLSFHSAVTLYVNSSFLKTIFSGTEMAAIFSACALLIMLTLSEASHLLRKFGAYSTTIVMILLEGISLLFLPLATSRPLIAALFILHYVVVTHLFYNFDVFTESESTDESTGATRGLFLTILNLAVIFGPVTGGLVLGGTNDYSKIYFLSTALLLPVLFITVAYLRDFIDPHYKSVKWGVIVKKVWKNRDLRSISIANLLMQFFYSWMIIYVPIYLTERMGFSWENIGIMFGIMLLPFVLFQLPLGWIADKWIGEKEILFAGFLFMGMTTASLSFIVSSSVMAWALLLFGTRVGACAVEVMTETYFFKKIDGSDAGVLGFFRYTAPLSLLIGPIFASVFLTVFDMRAMFLTLGLIMMSGMYFALQIKDTK